MPARMPRRLSVLLCLAALGAGLVACGEADVEQGVEEPAREGLALELEGLEYNVFITRELNPRIPPDNAYVAADTEPDKDETLYGVFLQVCNRSDDPHTAVNRFRIVDNQGNEFEPEELPSDNQFAYHAKELLPDECLPAGGSVAQLGPTAALMLLFRLPLANTEYRPLELEILGTGDAHLTYELDI
jgi:hypothetical protein